MPTIKHCVNCDKDYDEETNDRLACVHHPGAYGRCGPVRKGTGWTCCGRDLNDKPCTTKAHTDVYERRTSLVDEMEKFMKRNNSVGPTGVKAPAATAGNAP